MVDRRLLSMSLLVVVVMLLSGCSGDEDQIKGGDAGSIVIEDLGTLPVTIKGEAFELELALTQASREQGLSDRPSIAADGGMLFVFPREEQRAFVMRRCLVPIDIAFLNAQGKVVWMHAMQVEADPDAPDNRLKHYISHYPAQFAIELKEGTLRRLGLKQEDQIDLPLEELKAHTR